MRSFTSPFQKHKKDNQSLENTANNPLHTPLTTISPIIIQNEDQSEGGGQQSLKSSMKKLCDAYIQLVGIRSPCEFNAKDLIINNIKQRRVYDLMNILQGCGYVRRISKGKYQSFNFEEPSQQQNNLQMKVQETSLSSIAFHVKKLLTNHQGYKPFKDICSEVYGLHLCKIANMESLKRRIYECCKVLKVLGLAQKRGTSFKWKGVYSEASVNQSETHYKKSNKMKIRTKQKKQTQWYIPIVQQILAKIVSQNELNTFIGTLRAEFYKKIQYIPVKRQLNFD